MRLARRWNFKRYFAIIGLAAMTYFGAMRCISLYRADRCLDAGGSYDEASGSCRDGSGDDPTRGNLP